jgi:hypothetical protein
MARTNRELQQAHRERLRAQGLRLVQLWLPDVRSPIFTAQVRRDVAAAAAHVETPTERALSDAWERASWEALPEWTGPDLTEQ